MAETNSTAVPTATVYALIALHLGGSIIHILHYTRKHFWDFAFFGDIPFHIYKLPAYKIYATLKYRSSI